MWDGLIGTLNSWDVYLFYLVNLNIQNQFLNIIMPIITFAGTEIFWIIVCAVIFIFGGEKGRKVAVLCLIALTLGYFISETLKYLVARPRPFTVLNGVNFQVFMEGYSFPSGHSVASFTACTILGIKYGYLYLFLTLAFLVGFSRIYLGIHYPSDVIFGALIGVLCSLVILKWADPLWDKILKFKSKLKQRHS
jgi:undecaprenyl-diphosphatase